MGTVNFVIYMREDLQPEVKEKIAGWNLADVIKQLNIPEGKISSHGKDTATITGTSNAVAASLKMTLSQWCVIESYVQNHPKITPHMGPLARGG